MPLKVRFLTKCHTEARRGRRITKTKQWKSRRHRRCIERRSLFANSISLNTKRLSQNSYQEFVRYTSVALCAVGTSVTLCVTSVPSVTPCAYYIRLLVYHSIFQKSHNLFLCHLFCKLFLCSSKSIHALLASKRRPIGLQKVPFKPLADALLTSY